ncbi:MAG TPA: DUF2795 domain-containing protein [Agromyces sp.]
MMTPNPIEVQKFLGGLDYPASKDDILRTAKDAGAGDDVVEALEKIDDRDYEDPTEVSEAIAF